MYAISRGGSQRILAGGILFGKLLQDHCHHVSHLRILISDSGAGLAETKEADIKELALLNKALVESLAPELKTAEPSDLREITRNLDPHGRCFLLLALTLACQEGEPAPVSASLHEADS